MEVITENELFIYYIDRGLRVLQDKRKDMYMVDSKVHYDSLLSLFKIKKRVV